MGEEQEQKFQRGDIVTTDGKNRGRIIDAQFKKPVIIAGLGGQIRIAGELIPRWIYRVSGQDFSEQEWLREETLSFAY
jgi:hypothetical protein